MWKLFVLFVLAATGCVQMRDTKTGAAPLKESQRPAPRPVTADMVSPDTVHLVVNQFMDELDWEVEAYAREAQPRESRPALPK